MRGSRTSDKVAGALFLASFFLNAVICVANLYFMYEFNQVIAAIRAVAQMRGGYQG